MDRRHRISKIHKQGGDYKVVAYGYSNVMFTPTKAAEYRLCPTAEEAMSYFVGGDVVKGGYQEDGGFAIKNGKGWASCVCKNHQVQLQGGAYDLTSANWQQFHCGVHLRVHSLQQRQSANLPSPFLGPLCRCSCHQVTVKSAAGKPAAVTVAEVLEANVMFKAAEYRFRPTAEEAMSYFVGGDGGYQEDGGFAIKNGKGWASCVYRNHHVQGGVGLAPGHLYLFTYTSTGTLAAATAKCASSFRPVRCVNRPLHVVIVCLWILEMLVMAAALGPTSSVAMWFRVATRTPVVSPSTAARAGLPACTRATGAAEGWRRPCHGHV